MLREGTQAQTNPYTKRILRDLGILEQHYNSFVQITNRFKLSPGIYYKAQYNRDASIIMIDTVARQPIEPVNRPHPDWPDLNTETFQELTFPMWKMVCRGDPHAFSNLRWVLARRIVDDRTLRLIQYLFPHTEGDGFYRLPLTGDDLEFHIVLQSSMGRELAQFATLYYPQSLGWKTVSTVVIYYVSSIETYYMAVGFEYDEDSIETMREVPELRPSQWPHDDPRPPDPHDLGLM